MILRRKWSKVPAPAALLLVMGPCPRDVDRDPNRNVENQEKRLFLMTALLNKGADVNVRDEEDGLTPLHYAAELGFIKDMQLLLKYGAQIDQRDGAGQTPLFSAVRSHGAAVGLLLDRGANTSLRDRDGHTALHIAAMEDERSAELLLKRGADGHVKDNYGATPLKIAQIHHCLQAISLLEQWEARNPRHL